MTEPQASAIGITGRISLRTLIIIRWIAVAGQLSAVLLPAAEGIAEGLTELGL